MATVRESTMNLFQVDAFTDRIFRGNPACVCLLDAERPDEWMQALAAEMNLSETAYVLREGGGPAFRLRWFTPTTEVSLCGHATLATAHTLWEEGRLSPEEPALFDTRSGRLSARRVKDGIEMAFPRRDLDTVGVPEEIAEALGVRPVAAARYAEPDGSLYLFEAETERAVRDLAPDLVGLRRAGKRSFVVTAKAESPGFDFVSRFFAPAFGIDEDPVTGSAHCYLAPYWARKLGKNELVGFQASRRTGIIRCVLGQDAVLLTGKAVTVFRGRLTAQ